jgi:hypothetical protein
VGLIADVSCAVDVWWATIVKGGLDRDRANCVKSKQQKTTQQKRRLANASKIDSTQ